MSNSESGNADSGNPDAGNLGGIFSRWVGTGRTAFLDVTHGDISAPVEVGFDEFDDRCGNVLEDHTVIFPV